MKTNMARILYLVLALMMSVACFTACKEDDDATPTDVTNTDVNNTVSLVENVVVEVDDTAPYTINKDANGKDLVILIPNDDGSITMTVAEKTTLEAFLAVVVAKDGYAVKVSDAAGKEVTDTKAIIAKGMIFEVYKDGAATSEVKMVIDVVASKVIEQKVEEQKEVEEQNSEILQQASAVKNPSKVPGKDPATSNPSNPSTPSNPGNTSKPSAKAIDITLNSVWAPSYSGSDATGKAWQATLNTMKTKKNISTEINIMDYNTATDSIVKEVMAGKASADVYEVSMVMCRDAARKKALCNLFDSTTLNKSLYDTSATTSATFGGKVYGVSFYGRSRDIGGVLYNKNLIKKYAGKYDLMKLYETKKWTFDTFEAVARLCTVDTDGNGTTDIYGFTSNTNAIGMALTANAGGTALMKNGKVEATMCNDEGIAALEWCKKLFKDDKTWKYYADIYVCVNDFASGKSAMLVTSSEFYTMVAATADFEMGLVPMPIGPDQTDYKCGSYDSILYVVPKTKQPRLDDIGLWLNGVAAVSSTIINLNTQEMMRNGLDADSVSVWKWLLRNMAPEYSAGVFSGDVSSQVDGSVTVASKSPSKVMTAIKSQAQKECDDYFADLY